jgi:hypothetical protein
MERSVRHLRLHVFTSRTKCSCFNPEALSSILKTPPLRSAHIIRVELQNLNPATWSWGRPRLDILDLFLEMNDGIRHFRKTSSTVNHLCYEAIDNLCSLVR